MKKILIIILIVLLVALGLSVITNGFRLGGINVLSFKSLGGLNDQLDRKLSEATTLTSVTFPEKQSNLSKEAKQLATTREKYQDKVAYSSEEDVRKANEIETYQVDFLFTRLGNHAKKYGLVIDLDAKQSSATGVYNLNFTVHGKYSLISDFIRAVENDEELTFTIENFILELEDINTEKLKAQFMVPEIRLDVDESISNPDASSTINTSDTNTTNTRNTTNTTNTTDTTNTTNTTRNTTTNGG